MLVPFLQQFNIPVFDFLTVSAALGLLLFFLLAWLCTPALCVLTESVYTAGRKAFYDKCALQLTQSCAASGLFIFCVTGAAAALFFNQYQPELLKAPLCWRPLAFFALPAVSLALLLLYLFTWSALKKIRPLHLTVGLLAALSALAALAGTFLVGASMQQPYMPQLLWEAPWKAFAGIAADVLPSPAVWGALAYLFLSGLAAGCGLAQLWLIARRFKADYGRDYYTFAMRYCARFACASMALATVCGGGVYCYLKQAIPAGLRQTEDPAIMLIAAGLPVCSCLLWLGIVKSDRPLRHKPSAFFACLFLFVALCSQILLLFNAFPAA